MRKIFLIISISLCLQSYAQVYTLRIIAVNNNPDSLYTKNGSSDTLWRKVSGVYTMAFTTPRFGFIPVFQFAATAKTLAAFGITDGVTNTTTVNGHPLNANVTVTAGDVGLDTTRANVWAALAGKQAAGSYLLSNGSAASLTNFPTLNQNTLGTAAGLSANILESQVTNLVNDLAAKAPLASPTLITPVIGVATGTSLVVSGAIFSSGAAGIGYSTGAGGTVTQLTSRSTGVTLNKISGAITTNATSLAAGAEATFVVTNSTVAVGDVILLSPRSGQTANTSVAFISAVAAGSFSITLSNLNASTADTGAMIINFIVLKSVSN